MENITIEDNRTLQINSHCGLCQIKSSEFTLLYADIADSIRNNMFEMTKSEFIYKLFELTIDMNYCGFFNHTNGQL